MQEFHDQAKLIEEKLIESHQEILEKFEKRIENEIPQNTKDSAELLNQRRIQSSLAKQQKLINDKKKKKFFCI